LKLTELRIDQKSKSSLAAQFLLAADHFCEVLWDTFVAGALVDIEEDGRALKRAMSLGSARLIIESISRRSRALITNVPVSSSSHSSSSRNAVP
jgi:hypothetical protein